MSYYICGFIDGKIITDNFSRFFSKLSDEYKINMSQITKNELYGFPMEFIPSQNEQCFIISDHKGTMNATFLLDTDNYDPEADIGFPSIGKERIMIFIKVIEELIKMLQYGRVIFALMDEFTLIEEIKELKMLELSETLLNDVLKFEGPTNTLYLINKI